MGSASAKPLLRLGEDGVERQALRLHAREDVVAGAVQDARDAREAVAGEPLADGANHRDATSDRGFEAEVDAALGGEAQQFRRLRAPSVACWP